MKHNRDALTGKYIGKEEAANRDPATYVTETDSKRLLLDIYQDIMENVGLLNSVKVKYIEEAFRRAGLDV
jgi:hypothetical protein